MLKFLKKDFLVGLGAGFIISGIMIAYFGIGQPTDDEIRARASKLGMIQKSSGEIEQGRPGQSSNSSGQDAMDSKTNETPLPANKTATTISTDTSVQNRNPESVKKLTNVVIEIKPGMGSETVARILEEKGVVKDKNAFYTVVTAKRAHSKFKVGKFSVPVGGDMEQILSILTGK